jgi:hypothetical protein
MLNEKLLEPDQLDGDEICTTIEEVLLLLGDGALWVKCHTVTMI